MINLIDEDGRVTLVNREWERVLGWSPEEVMERGAAILAEAYPDLQQRQKALNLISTSREEWADFKTRVRDGRVIDTSWAAVHLSDGTAIVFGIDITERKQVENKLGERVKELTALHAISRVLQQEWPGTKVLLGKLTLLLPPAFQHPEITAVQLRIGQATVETPGFSEFARSLAGRLQNHRWAVRKRPGHLHRRSPPRGRRTFPERGASPHQHSGGHAMHSL